MEFFNKVIASEAQLIRKEHWIYEPPVMADFVAKSIYMDPAVSEKRTADSTVIAVAGITKKGKIWLLDMWGKRTSDEVEKIDTYFAMSRRWGVPTFGRYHGVESNAYQAALAHRIREEMFRQKHYFELESVTNKSKKISRIKEGFVQPLVAGYVRCARRFHPLEIEGAEFREDGTHKHDDWLDAAAGALGLLADAAPAASSIDLTADIYEPLEQELGGEWRWA
jgi:hypothetical protein